jgi:hypothetical protein
MSTRRHLVTLTAVGALAWLPMSCGEKDVGVRRTAPIAKIEVDPASADASGQSPAPVVPGSIGKSKPKPGSGTSPGGTTATATSSLASSETGTLTEVGTAIETDTETTMQPPPTDGDEPPMGAPVPMPLFQ